MRLSFIVCTRNRALALEDCLRSIITSISYAACDSAEIVVVNNASTDTTSATVTAFAKSSSTPVQLIYEPRKGLSAARNAGVRTSHGELVAFTDDDCQVSQTYVEELMRYDAKDELLVMRSGSVVLGDPTDLPLTIKSTTTMQSWKRPMNLKGEGELMSSLIGCNMTMRRAVLDRLGPFDEKLGAGTDCPAAEDTDYFYRAYLAGILLEMVPDMIIKHYHGRKETTDQKNLLRNYSIGNGALSIKYLFRYPNFSRHFYWAIKYYFTELFTKKDNDQFSTSITPGEQLSYMLIGAFLYLRTCLKIRG